MLPHHRSTPHQYFSPIGSHHIINQHHIISQCHIIGLIECCHIIEQCHVIVSYMWIVSYLWIVLYMWILPYTWQYQICFYVPPRVFDYSELANVICFTIRLLVSHEIAKISLKYIKYLNYNQTHLIKVYKI